MDIASVAGLVIVLIGVFLGMVLKGADPVAMFTNAPAILIVILGSIGAVVLSYPMDTTKNALKALMKVFFPGPPPDMTGTITQITSLAERARREGLLALEEEAGKIEDPFLQGALRQVIDGADPDDLRRTLLSDVKATKERHKRVIGWFTQTGIYSPTFGIIGAVVGLIAVMAKLDDPSKMGKGIGAAFVATFWGVFMANGLFLPWASKLKAHSEAEIAHKMLMIEGVLSVQQGQSARSVLETLNTHLPASQRQAA